jgi:hypothetical protein
MSIKKAPVTVRLSDRDVHHSDLMQELKVDKHRLGSELLSQPAKYAWWGSLYAEVESKADLLEIRLEEMFSELAKNYLENSKGKVTATHVKQLIVGNHKYQKLRRRVWRWRKSERFLKQAVRAWDQRLNALQSYAADQRKERDSEPKVR